MEHTGYPGYVESASLGESFFATMSNRDQVSSVETVTEPKGIEKPRAVKMNTTFSVFATALGGVQRNLRGLTADAHRIATAPVERTDPMELVDPLVSALQHQRGLEASAYALRRADDALGTLLDTFA